MQPRRQATTWCRLPGPWQASNTPQGFWARWGDGCEDRGFSGGKVVICRSCSRAGSGPRANALRARGRAPCAAAMAACGPRCPRRTPCGASGHGRGPRRCARPPAISSAGALAASSGCAFSLTWGVRAPGCTAFLEVCAEWASHKAKKQTAKADHDFASSEPRRPRSGTAIVYV